MNNQADNHQSNNRQADNWLDKENDVKKRNCVSLRPNSPFLTDRPSVKCVWYKTIILKKMQMTKEGVLILFSSQKSKVWMDVGSWDRHTWWRSKKGQWTDWKQ